MSLQIIKDIKPHDIKSTGFIALLKFSVSDNGIGLTNDTLDSLNSPKGSVELENHGLGLTIVRQIVKAHRETAEFRNLIEGGCAIILCLPLSNEV